MSSGLPNNIEGRWYINGSEVTKTAAQINAAGTSSLVKNLIIGGNFDTNPWQRGTTFTGAADTVYTADRFQMTNTGAGVFDVIKTADAPTVAEAGIFTQNCFHIDVTTADASIAAGDWYDVHYKMEGYDFAQIAQRAFTLSFWVKATVTGVYSVGFSNTGSDANYVAEYTVNTTNTWEFKTITVSASPSAGTWNYTNGIGMRIDWSIACGSNRTTSTLNSWSGGSGKYASTNQVNGMSSNSNNFKLALVQVEAGSSASAFELRSIQQELALCQRYYAKTFPIATAPVQNVGNFDGAITYLCTNTGVVNQGATWKFTINMRDIPSVTFYNPKAAATTFYNNTAAAVSGASTAIAIGEGSLFAQNAQVAGDNPGNVIGIHATADAEL